MSAAKSTRLIGRDFLYSQILDKIQYCEWEPGMPIKEADICALYGVSKTPVREALLLLSKEHYVDIYPQSGCYVSKIDIKRISDLIYLRNSVEKRIISDLAKTKQTISPETEKSILLMEYAIKSQDWKECVKLDYAFHKSLFTLAEKECVWEIIEKNLPHWTRFRFFDTVVMDEYTKSPSTFDEHRMIISYIAEGNTTQLKKLIDIHIDPNFKKTYKRKVLQNNYKFFENIEFIDHI